MDNRLYFVLGDLFSNIVIGALVGFVAAAMVSTGWNMWLAMVLMMVTGMLLSLVGALALGIFFGAMEVMVPAMQTGMMAGMVVGMWAAMTTLGPGQGALIGGITGVLVLNIIWVANIALRGVQATPPGDSV